MCVIMQMLMSEEGKFKDLKLQLISCVHSSDSNLLMRHTHTCSLSMLTRLNHMQNNKCTL